MKILKFYNYVLLLGLGLLAVGCEKPVDPYPEFQTVPHGFGKYKAGTPTSMFFGQNGSKLEGDLQWISTDGKVTVTEIDLYVSWSESYLDQDGLPKTAVHGKKKITTLASAGAARTPQAWSFSAADVYNLYKGITFDYKDGAGARNVFDNPKDTRRSASSYFTPNDKFVISWGFKAQDGRYFDTWSGGICNNSVGANCTLNFGVVCNSAIEGTYKGVTSGTSTDGCCPGTVEAEATVTLTKVGTGKYEISDFSSGLYKKWYEIYGIDDTYMANIDKTKNKLRGDITDACNKISGAWTEPFGETMTIAGDVDPATGKITYNWVNGYGDKASVTLTKQ